MTTSIRWRWIGAIAAMLLFVTVGCSPPPPDASLIPAGQGWQCASEPVARSGGPEVGICHRTCDFTGWNTDRSAREATCRAVDRAWCFTVRSSGGTRSWHCTDIAARCRSWREDRSDDEEISECAELP